MGSAGLQLAQVPGFLPQPSSALVAGVGINGLTLSRIQMNADFAATRMEVFYSEIEDGDSLALPQSLTDGYQYSASEIIPYWEYRSTVKDITGIPLADGGLLILNSWIDPYSLSVANAVEYMVQGGKTTPTTDGKLACWAIGQRGRGLLAGPGYTPSYSYLANSAFASSPALTQALLQQWNDSAMAGASRLEAFTDTGAGTAWRAGQTVAAAYVVKPTIYHANGCSYTALINGTTGDVEPGWPTQISSLFWDGSVLWSCTARGFQNGQTFALPTSWDGHAYTAGEFVGGLCSWISTGQPNNTGPSGNGRLQRLQKSIGSARVVSTTCTYWDGNNQTVGNNSGAGPNDGLVHVVAFFQRAVAAQPSTPPPYNVMSGQEFMSGSTVTSALLDDLNENINNAIARPTAFLETAIASASAPALPTDPVTLYAYERSECFNLYGLDDTGAIASGVDKALRLFQTTLDPASGLATLRVDYNQSGGQVTSANGSLDVVTLAARQSYVLLDGLSILNLAGSPVAIGPGGGNIIANGSMQVWGSLLKSGTQVVATPASWSVSNNTQDGYNTQQPGNVGPYAVGLDVGNAHGPANNQYVSDLSYPAAIVPGDLYSFEVWAMASPAISTGWRFRIHLRDINFANDVWFDLAPLQGLGTAWTQFSGKFYMPIAGQTAVQTATGSATLSGAAPAEVTYLYAEIWNYEPNVSSTVIVGLVDIECVSGALDAVSPANSAQALASTANLVQSGTATLIDVSANSLATPYKSATYASGTIDPGAYGTWYIYAVDAQLAGGSVAYQATSAESTLASIPGCIRMGVITTYTTGGGSGGGGGGGSLSIQTANFHGYVGTSIAGTSILAAGGMTPYAFTTVGGALPASVSLSGTGALTGTPSVAGSGTVTVKVVDSSSPAQTATSPVGWTIAP